LHKECLGQAWAGLNVQPARQTFGPAGTIVISKLSRASHGLPSPCRALMSMVKFWKTLTRQQVKQQTLWTAWRVKQKLQTNSVHAYTPEHHIIYKCEFVHEKIHTSILAAIHVHYHTTPALWPDVKHFSRLAKHKKCLTFFAVSSHTNILMTNYLIATVFKRKVSQLAMNCRREMHSSRLTCSRLWQCFNMLRKLFWNGLQKFLCS